jgi:predicted ferric reductase
MSMLQTTAAGASMPVSARWVRGWVRGGAAVICGLCLFNTVGGDESGPLLDLARLTGLEAGYAVLAALLLMARIPALDRQVGSDQLALLHAWVGRWIIGTALAHTVLAILGYASLINRSVTGEIADLNTQYPDVLLATVALGLFLLVAVTSARAARKRLQYETWYLVHLYTYLAIALSFAHQFSTGTDFRYTDARVIWSAMYLAVAIALLRYRVFEPLRVNWRHRLRVLDVYPESPDTVSVYLTGRALDRLDARPGQFFRWRFATRGLWWAATPYSLSAPASADGLRITARMVGRHSNQLKTLPFGTRVFIEGPYGALTSQQAHHRSAVLIAGGVGITPLRALFETLPATSITLLYRASSQADLVLTHELNTIARQRHATVHYVTGHRRRGDADPLSAASLRRLLGNLPEHDIYLCGPPGMTASVRRALHELGVGDADIHEETFAF